MGTTPTYSWPYPEPTDPVANGAQDIEDLALAVESTVSGLSGGQILQVVSTTKTDTFSTSVSSNSYSGNITGLEATITPTSATSTIFIMVTLHASHQSYGQANYRIVRGSTPIGVGDAAGSRAQLTSGLQPADVTASTTSVVMNMSAHHMDSPATTSAITYGVQLYNINPTGTMYVNRTPQDTDSTSRGRYVSSITAWEVSA